MNLYNTGPLLVLHPLTPPHHFESSTAVMWSTRHTHEKYQLCPLRVETRTEHSLSVVGQISWKEGKMRQRISQYMSSNYRDILIGTLTEVSILPVVHG